MLIILKQLSVLYLFLLLGYLFGKRSREQTEHTGILSFLLVNLFLPSKVFNTFSQNFTVSYITENGKTILISVVFLLAIIGFSLAVAKCLTKNDYEQRVYRYSLTLANYAYMGYALCESVFGASGLTDLILFCIPFAIYTYTFGYAMLTGKGKMLKKLVNPMTVAIALGIVFGLTGFEVPEIFATILSGSSACVAPLSMLLTGLTLSAFTMRELVRDYKAYVLAGIRLIVLPALVFAACRLFELDSVIMPAVMMSCMPCGLNTIVFPKLVNEDCRLGAKLCLLSHLFSIATIPFWLSLVK
ncbi:MAG: AEC family transporter [Clostridia bacterium]|nr:AEC family transporter [Clostridia bacterium]